MTKLNKKFSHNNFDGMWKYISGVKIYEKICAKLYVG